MQREKLKKLAIKHARKMFWITWWRSIKKKMQMKRKKRILSKKDFFKIIDEIEPPIPDRTPLSGFSIFNPVNTQKGPFRPWRGKSRRLYVGLNEPPHSKLRGN